MAYDLNKAVSVEGLKETAVRLRNEYISLIQSSGGSADMEEVKSYVDEYLNGSLASEEEIGEMLDEIFAENKNQQ